MKKWTIQEINLIKEIYPVTPVKDLAKRLNRSESSVNHKAFRLKIKAIREYHFPDWDFKWDKTPRKCLVCGKEFIPTRKEYYVCSTKCGTRSRKGITAYKKVSIKCNFCRKIILKTPYRIKQSKLNFCDIKCFAAWKQENQKKDKNPNWKGGISFVNRGRAGKGSRHYRKGEYYERKARKELESEGYYVIRSGGSKGIWDLVAINKNEIRLIQVKSNSKPGPKERKNMEEFESPSNAIKEFWRYYGRNKRIIVKF